MTESRPESRRERLDKLTAFAREDPRAFRAEMKRLMRRGNLYVKGVLAFLLVVTLLSVISIPLGGGAGAVLLIWFAGGAGLFIWNAMRGWASRPEGVPLRPDQAPKLFALIDEARRAAGNPPIHRVHLTDTFNAAVTISRSRGVVGRQQNTLLIGLPLMYGLPRDELHAVIAHECAHLSDRQSGELMRMWELQNVWKNVAISMMKGDAFGGMLFRPFFRSFLPRFLDWSLVFTRELELDADHHGMLQTDRETAVRLEIRLAVVGARLQARFRETLRDVAKDQPEPPPGLLQLKCKLAAEPLTERDQRYLVLALSRSTGWRDSHPACRDRLASYGFDPADATLPEPVDAAAADTLLTDALDDLESQLNEHLRSELQEWWIQTHKRQTRDQEELQRLAHDVRFEPLEEDDLRLRAILRARHLPDARGEARETLESLVDPENEADPEALEALGTLRLADGDTSGIALLERAATLRPERAAHLRHAIALHHAEAGRGDAAAAILEQAQEVEEVSAETQIARFTVHNRVPLGPHDLDHDALDGLVRVLESEEHVAEAWLAARILPEPTARPVFLLMIRDRLDGRVLFTGRARAALYDALNGRIRLDGDVLLIPLSEPIYELWRRMRQQPGASVYLMKGEEPSR